MHKIYFSFILFLSVCISQKTIAQANAEDYLNDIKTELKKEWPKNRTINLVFHGHSVPAGYFKTPVVNTFESYPFLFFKELKALYPNAVVNVIITGERGRKFSEWRKKI